MTKNAYVRAMFFEAPVSALVVVLLSAFSGQVDAQQPDSIKKLPDVNWIRSHKIDVKHIAIDLRFDWQKKQGHGTTSITVSPFRPTDKITLDAGMLTINTVVLNNGMPLKFTYDGGDKNDGLSITLDRIYHNGEDLTVTIDYHTNWVNVTDPNNLGGSIGKGIRFFEPTLTEPNRRKQIWSMGEPESNRYWFPCYDSPNDLRTTAFRATVDKELSVISNGILEEVTKNADDTRTFQYKMDTPYANHLTSFVVGQYVDVAQNYDGIPLHNYSYPEEVEATTASVERLPDMVKYFSELTGARYPYPAYSQVFVQDLPWGMAGMAVSTQTENMVDDFGTHADFLYLWDALEGESLAKQWFGNYLTPRDWSHGWLNRGFARYFSSLYDEYKNGREEFLLYQHSYDHSVYFNDWNAGTREPVVNRNYESADASAASNYPYFHGASVLHMLRKHLGEENWRKAIRLYVMSNANKLVSTEDFRKAVEEASGESMDWFFDQWLYKTGHPIFEITKNYDETKKQLTLNVMQTQKVDPSALYPQVAFFKGRVEIEIDGSIEQVWLEPKVENKFTFACPQRPKLVNFDYENTWIKEITFEKSLDELLYQFQTQGDILGRQWAMNQLFNLAKDEKSTPADKEKIAAAFRNVIMSNSYWRLRSLAIVQLRNLLVPSTDKPAILDDATKKMLLRVIKNDKAWVRAGAINFLGMTRDPKFADVYLDALKDPSDRVINAAALALGKSKSAKAYRSLVELTTKPSWKNQSLISSLNGLKELGDQRGFDIAFNALSNLNLVRWSLPTAVWDFRITAAETIVALGRGDAAYPLIFDRFKKSIEENDLNVIFSNVLLITTLADPRGQEVFELLKAKFKTDDNTMLAVNQYETQFNDALKERQQNSLK